LIIKCIASAPRKQNPGYNPTRKNLGRAPTNDAQMVTQTNSSGTNFGRDSRRRND